MKRNYKILEGGVQPLSELSDAEINKLYKVYSEMDGKHKNFKGTKREYCFTVAGLIEDFLTTVEHDVEKQSKLSGSGKESRRLKDSIIRRKTALEGYEREYATKLPEGTLIADIKTLEAYLKVSKKLSKRRQRYYANYQPEILRNEIDLKTKNTALATAETDKLNRIDEIQRLNNDNKKQNARIAELDKQIRVTILSKNQATLSPALIQRKKDKDAEIKNCKDKITANTNTIGNDTPIALQTDIVRIRKEIQQNKNVLNNIVSNAVKIKNYMDDNLKTEQQFEADLKAKEKILGDQAMTRVNIEKIYRGIETAQQKLIARRETKKQKIRELVREYFPEGEAIFNPDKLTTLGKLPFHMSKYEEDPLSPSVVNTGRHIEGHPIGPKIEGVRRQYTETENKEVRNPFYGVDMEGSTSAEKYKRLEDRAYYYRKVIKAFKPDDTAIKDFLISVTFKDIIKKTPLGIFTRENYAAHLAHKGRMVYYPDQTQRDWTVSDEGAFRTEDLCVTKIFIPSSATLKQKVIYTFLNLGKIYSYRQRTVKVDFNFKGSNFTGDSKGKTTVLAKETGEPATPQVDWDKILAILFDSATIEPDNSISYKNPNALFTCYHNNNAMCQYNEDDPNSKIPVEIILGIDLEKIVIDNLSTVIPVPPTPVPVNFDYRTDKEIFEETLRDYIDKKIPKPYLRPIPGVPIPAPGAPAPPPPLISYAELTPKRHSAIVSHTKNKPAVEAKAAITHSAAIPEVTEIVKVKAQKAKPAKPATSRKPATPAIPAVIGVKGRAYQAAVPAMPLANPITATDEIPAETKNPLLGYIQDAFKTYYGFNTLGAIGNGDYFEMDLTEPKFHNGLKTVLWSKTLFPPPPPPAGVVPIAPIPQYIPTAKDYVNVYRTGAILSYTGDTMANLAVNEKLKDEWEIKPKPDEPLIEDFEESSEDEAEPTLDEMKAYLVSKDELTARGAAKASAATIKELYNDLPIGIIRPPKPPVVVKPYAYGTDTRKYLLTDLIPLVNAAVTPLKTSDDLIRAAKEVVDYNLGPVTPAIAAAAALTPGATLPAAAVAAPVLPLGVGTPIALIAPVVGPQATAVGPQPIISPAQAAAVTAQTPYDIAYNFATTNDFRKYRYNTNPTEDELKTDLTAYYDLHPAKQSRFPAEVKTFIGRGKPDNERKSKSYHKKVIKYY